MLRLVRSFYAKVFLMSMGAIMTLFVFNQSLIGIIVNNEIKNIFRDQVVQTNLQWRARDASWTDPKALQEELLQALENARPDEVMVLGFPLDAADAHKPDQFFIPATLGKSTVVPDPVTEHFPMMSHARVTLGEHEWLATKLIAPDGIIISLVNATASARQLERFLEFRTRMVRKVFPFTLMVTIILALLVSYRVLAPVKRIQTSLRRLDSRDLGVRIGSRGEDKEFSEFIQVFNHMLERLERGFQQASRFSSDAAHELRTPLTIMQGYIERAIAEAEPGSRMQIQLLMVGDEIERLTSITQKLLLLAQADAGHLSMDIETVNVSDALEEMRLDMTMLDPALEIRGKVEKKLMLNTDRALFQQMINNLFSNAVKYNEPGGWIDISAWSAHGQLHVSFSNPSQPLSEEFASKAFERFSRGDASHNRRIDGTGLGLSLSREIAIANKGSLSFQVRQQREVIVEFIAPLTGAASAPKLA